MTDRILQLNTMATQIRRDVVNTVYAAGDGHPGPCMSIADILAVLYFDIRLPHDKKSARGNTGVFLAFGAPAHSRDNHFSDERHRLFKDPDRAL